MAEGDADGRKDGRADAITETASAGITSHDARSIGDGQIGLGGFQPDPLNKL